MKIVSIGPDAIFYRYLTPKWAFVPLSGAGAASEGGRFNRAGVEALYLSLPPQTALEEYRQDYGPALVEGLRLLHDVLAPTPFADRFWMWGGLLLGWARDGAPIPGDADADFAYAAADDDLLVATMPLLRAHGFREWFTFRTGTGPATTSRPAITTGRATSGLRGQ